MTGTRPLIEPGTTLAGRWQIQDSIGGGDTGEVYGVRDLHGAGTFALKLFWPSTLARAELWTAVQQTARTAAGLGVEAVARAHDFGIDANSARPFLVCERVSWAPLADRVRLQGPLTPAEIATALHVLARALDTAHTVGLVHRDLKPENVFIAPNNPHWVRVTDFGAALLRCASPAPPGWGGAVGWVAPEAADPSAASTPAMDLFALGLVTFFAMTGGALHRAARRPPIDAGALWQELAQPLGSPAARARELGAAVDPAFDPWFERAVAANPQSRFASAGEMAKAFDAITRGLVAAQSDSAVAVPGVAAAIAQPLIFQPEPPPASAFELPPPAVRAEPPTGSESASSSAIPGASKKHAAPLFLAGAAICFAITALGAFAIHQHRRAVDAAAAPDPTAPRTSAPSVPPSATQALTAEAALAAPTPLPVATTPMSAAPAASPPALSSSVETEQRAATKPTVVLAAKPLPSSAGSASAQRSIALSTAAAPTLKAKPVSALSKPGAAAKPATLPSVPVHKKCGSVFIPCK